MMVVWLALKYVSNASNTFYCCFIGMLNTVREIAFATCATFMARGAQVEKHISRLFYTWTNIWCRSIYLSILVHMWAGEKSPVGQSSFASVSYAISSRCMNFFFDCRTIMARGARESTKNIPTVILKVQPCSGINPSVATYRCTWEQARGLRLQNKQLYCSFTGNCKTPYELAHKRAAKVMARSARVEKKQCYGHVVYQRFSEIDPFI